MKFLSFFIVNLIIYIIGFFTTYKMTRRFYRIHGSSPELMDIFLVVTPYINLIAALIYLSILAGEKLSNKFRGKIDPHRFFRL